MNTDQHLHNSSNTLDKITLGYRLSQEFRAPKFRPDVHDGYLTVSELIDNDLLPLLARQHATY